jgi:myo-inositol-1(or 4)-monophosphatase
LLSFPIDIEICTGLLRAMTDRIAAVTKRPGPDQDLSSIIQWVNQASKDAADTLSSQLASQYPDIGWMGEEERAEGCNSAYWLYDPIDGAYHFLQGLPLWSSSLVLMLNGEPVFSAVYDATSAEIFVATRRQGATCNGKPISVSAKTDLSTAVVGTAIPPLAQVGEAEQDQALALIGAVSKRVFVVRPMAAVSLQLAYVAAGRLDAYWENGRDAADWLAGSLLVTEAGGRVSDLTGHAFGWAGNGVLAGNAHLHGALLPVVSAVRGNDEDQMR